MAEPLPSASNEVDENVPANAEDRRAAAALNALDSNTMENSSSADPPSSSKQIDSDALGAAMNRLEVASGTAKKDSDAAEKKPSKSEEKKKLEEEEAKRKKAVKVKAEDVSFLVEELDLSKVKATDLLKSYEGDCKKAVRAFVQPGGVKGIEWLWSARNTAMRKGLA